MGEDKDSEAARSELALAVPRKGKLQVVPYFLLPDRETLVPEIDLDEHRRDARWRLEFDIAVRDQPEAGRERLVKGDPAAEAHPGCRYNPVLQGAIDLVHNELVLHKEVGGERFVLPPPWS